MKSLTGPSVSDCHSILFLESLLLIEPSPRHNTELLPHCWERLRILGENHDCLLNRTPRHFGGSISQFRGGELSSTAYAEKRTGGSGLEDKSEVGEVLGRSVRRSAKLFNMVG